MNSKYNTCSKCHGLYEVKQGNTMRKHFRYVWVKGQSTAKRRLCPGSDMPTSNEDIENWNNNLRNDAEK